jgi:hypothetical protein
MEPPIPPPRITTNLTRPQPITTNPTQPQRITANPITAKLTQLLTPPRRMVGNLTVEAENLMVAAENTTSQ